MRKTLAIILMFLGMFLLVIGVLAQFYAPDRLEKTPLDVHNVTHLSGTAQLGADTVPIKITSTTVTDSDKSDDTVVVWNNASCVVKDVDDVPDCVSTEDPGNRLISATTDEFATDRVSGLAVNDFKGLSSEATRHEGLVNKWPFNAQKKTYPYWDDTVGAAVDAEYVSTKDLDGITVYVYKLTVSDAPAEIADGISGLYSANTEFWVEPRTGDILNQIEDQTRTTTDGSPVLAIQAEFTEAQQKKSIESSKDNLSKLDLLEKWVPLVGYIVGAICLIAGILLTLSTRRQDGAATPAREKAHV